MKLSIIIPYRNREAHLKIFLNRIEKKVKTNFDVLVVEQNNKKLFNRGKLLNIGFNYKKESSDYFCFHDVDMIPKDVDYSYPNDSVVHLATKASQFDYKMPYPAYCGGVILFTKNDFLKINGFSNDFWGWGLEDDDLYLRIKNSNLKLTNRQCVFKSLPHEKAYKKEHYDKNYEKIKVSYDYKKDGLLNASYSLVKKEILNNFTENIKVDF